MSDWIKKLDTFNVSPTTAITSEADRVALITENFFAHREEWRFAIAVWPAESKDGSSGLDVGILTKSGRVRLAEDLRWLREEYIPMILKMLEN